MKTLISILTISFLSTVSLQQANAQLRVDNNGNTILKYGTFSAGYDAALYMGDFNHSIRAIYGQGVSISTFNASNAIFIKENTSAIGIFKTNPTFPLEVNGFVLANGYLTYSDQRLKKDIQPLNNRSSFLNNLSTVSYKYDPTKFNNLPQTEVGRTHFGFLAQEVENVFPELVMKDSSGTYVVDYLSFIPLLVESYKQQGKTIQELQMQVDNLQEQLAKTTGVTTDNASLKKAGIKQDILLTNSRQATINCFLPQTVNTPALYVYDMQGAVVKKININEKGDVNVALNSDDLKAGMYLLTLIADNQYLDTKRMIIME